MPHLSKIAFTVRGKQNSSHEPIILLHGYAGSVLHWHPVAERLAEEFQVYIPNLTHLYMGKQEFSFSEQVRIFGKWIQVHFPTGKVHLCGISYGAALAWAVSLEFPDLVGRVSLINPMPAAPIHKINVPIIKQVLRMPLSMKTLYLILRTPLGRFFLKRISQVFRVERADFWDRVDDLHGRKLLFVCHVIFRFAWILKNEQWSLWEQRLKSNWHHESLLVIDPEDTLFSHQAYRSFMADLNLKNQVELVGAGHMAIHTKPSEVSEVITKFINSSASARSA